MKVLKKQWIQNHNRNPLFQMMYTNRQVLIFQVWLFFSHSTYRKPREDTIANYVIWLKSKTCIFMACVASLAFRASCSWHVLAQKSFQLARKRTGLIPVILFFCNLNPLKHFLCPLGKLTEFTSPKAKSTCPGLSESTFFASACC